MIRGDYRGCDVGRDGLVGGAAALDGKMSLCRAIVQLPGEAITCKVDALSDAAFLSRSLISMLVRHEQTLYAQAQQSTSAWLPITSRRGSPAGCCGHVTFAGSDHLPFTQDFFCAEMLGVQRSSISPVSRILFNALA